MSQLWTDTTRNRDPKTPRFPGWSWSPSFREKVTAWWWQSRDLRGALLFLLVVVLLAATICGWLSVVVYSE